MSFFCAVSWQYAKICNLIIQYNFLQEIRKLCTTAFLVTVIKLNFDKNEKFWAKNFKIK